MTQTIRPAAATCYVTEACNSRCMTCAVWRTRGEPDLPTAEWTDALTQIGGLGVRYVCLSGGEPLLRNDLAKLVRAARDAGMTAVEAASNGLLLTRQRLDQLVDAGLTGLHLSVDGISDVHDRIRGLPGSFAAVRRALVLARARGLDVSVNMNLLADNLDQVPAVMDLAQEHRATWNPNFLNNTQRSFRGVDTESLLPRDETRIRILIEDLAVRLALPGLRSGLAPPHLPHLARMLATGRTPDFPCLLGSWLVYVYTDLSVSPGCNAIKPAGNLRHEPLADILAGPKYARKVKQMAMRNCPGCTCCIWHNLDQAEQAGSCEARA
ncbi:MAG: radical SAM protein [Pseudomonadota bacterium]